jgi:hypothetical protein
MCPQCGFPIDTGTINHSRFARAAAPIRRKIWIALAKRERPLPVSGSSDALAIFRQQPVIMPGSNLMH